MINKRLRTISVVIQILYTVACLTDIVICLLYLGSYDTAFGRACADLALDFTCALFLIPALPVSLVLNICARSENKEEHPRVDRWLLWTVLSPVAYVASFVIALGIFISITGGV